MVNFSEPVPEALTVLSICGVESPDRLPLLSPQVPTISAAVSKPTHRTTPGWLHSVWKAEEGGGDEPLLTFTVLVAIADKFPAPSFAWAPIVWEPLASVVVSIPKVQLFVPVAFKKLPESMRTCTAVTPTLSEAVPDTVAVPETVDPEAGAEIVSVGGVVSVGGEEAWFL